MKIEVLGRYLSSKFEPKVPTIAMRICGGPNSLFDDKSYLPLRESELYLATFEYVFDDIDLSQLTISELRENRYTLFNKEIGKQILNDFIKNKQHAQSLMINCYAGLGRSAAIASSLDEIFEFNLDREWETSHMNSYIYSEMLSLGKELGLGKFTRKS